MPKQDNLKDLIEKLNKAFASGIFKNFIEYIRFPFYKNLEENTKITFDFPFTVFTGQNGSGKSSALHAIQGAPANRSPSQFWFSSKVDPINEGNGNRNTLIYSYKEKNNNSIEVIKTRISDKKNQKELDLWETSRPILAYNMAKLPKGKRNPPISKEVYYSDFRAELSAYDKFMYFYDFKRTKRLLTRQDYVRFQSPKLRNVIDNNVIQTYKGINKNDFPILLNQIELEAVSKILGKKYIECKIIKHSFFRTEGYTIYFKTNSLNYSEAFAGRGEYAVVKIVHEVISALDGSMFILDEPEVSLHPEAQRELKYFLLEQTLKKKLQVVISSHSAQFIEGLPPKAIKLFYITSTEKFTVKNYTHEIEAFNFIGHELGTKRRICVEDKVAQLLLQRVIETIGNEFPLLFEVVYYPGGASELYKIAVKYSMEAETTKFLLLDGDELKSKKDPQTLTLIEAGSFEVLNTFIKDSTGSDFNKLGFHIDSLGGGGNPQQKIDASIKYLKFIWSNLEYFPGNSNPEELIWNSEYANSMLKNNRIAVQPFQDEHKTNFNKFCQLLFGDTTENSMLAAHKLFIQNFCTLKDDKFTEIVDILKKFKE